MYLVRTEATVRAGGAGELEAAITRLGEMRKGLPGYLGQTLLHSYSHPAKYTLTGRYENVEAAWAFNKSDVLSSWAKGITPGLFTITQQEGYEGVLDVDAENVQPSLGTCEVLVDWVLSNPGVAAEFEQSRRELFELRKQHSKGFVSNRLRRSGGIATRYLIIQIYTDLEAARSANLAPELRAFTQSHPASLYSNTPMAAEAYYVIHRM